MNEVHISTVGGSINTIGLVVNESTTKKVFSGKFKQTGVNAPLLTQEGENTTGAIFTFNYIGVGSYNIVSDLPLFTATTLLFWGNNNVQTTLGGNVVGWGKFTSSISSGDTIILGSFDGMNGGVPTDDRITDCSFKIEVITPIVTDEDNLIATLGLLDSTQLLIWDKIVLRGGVDVIQVDGASYRKTGNFASSSKVINS